MLKYLKQIKTFKGKIKRAKLAGIQLQSRNPESFVQGHHELRSGSETSLGNKEKQK